MKAHERLYKTAIKLSVYSSVLDFGLMLSVFLINSKVLPYTFSSFLMGMFSTAISYITAAIIALFSLSFVLRMKQKIVVIKTQPKETQHTEYKRIKVIATAPETTKPVVVRMSAPVANSASTPAPAIQRVVNNGKSFVNFNGVWYAAGRDRFERVKSPTY